MGNPYPAEIIDSNGFVKAGVEITFTDSQNQPGGATPGAAIVRGPFNFTHATAGLNNGVAFYTPTVGDLLLDALVVVDTAFDGTTPLLDIATFIDGTQGFWAQNKGPVLLSGAGQPNQSVNGLLLANNSTNTGGGVYAPQDLAAANVNVVAVNDIIVNVIVPAVFTTADPWKLVVSQDGTQGGTASGSTVGAARLYLVTATPTPFS